MNRETLLNKFSEFLDTLVGESKQENIVKSEVELPIVKPAIAPERRALFLVLEPQDEDGMTTDLHGDWYDAETVKAACHDYNQRCERVGIMHKNIASDEEVVVQESYIAPCDFVTETGFSVKKGSWLMWLHFPSEDMWGKVEDNTYDSVSIECAGVGYELK